jgi:hypothetical protein
MRNENHLGIAFQIWSGPQTWFWFVVNPHQNGGAIGAAASEADALREACLSIEEISAQLQAAATHRNDDCATSLICWKGALENLDRFLAAFNHATAA